MGGDTTREDFGVEQKPTLTRYKTGGYGAMVDSDTGPWVSHAEAASALATMTAHRDALASALRALHKWSDITLAYVASRRIPTPADMDKLTDALIDARMALREHADTGGAK